MTMHEEICALAVAFGGETADTALTESCKTALLELTGRLRPGLLPEDCRDALIPAAAWLALSQRAAVRRADGVERFSVADLSVQKANQSSARELRNQAEALLAPYLRDGLVFRGVRA